MYIIRNSIPYPNPNFQKIIDLKTNKNPTHTHTQQKHTMTQTHTKKKQNKTEENMTLFQRKLRTLDGISSLHTDMKIETKRFRLGIS